MSKKTVKSKKKFTTKVDSSTLELAEKEIKQFVKDKKATAEIKVEIEEPDVFGGCSDSCPEPEEKEPIKVELVVRLKVVTFIRSMIMDGCTESILRDVDDRVESLELDLLLNKYIVKLHGHHIRYFEPTAVLHYTPLGE